MVTAIAIAPNGTTEYVTVETLEDYQTLVGGYIEYVPTLYPNRAMVVNDEGLLLGLDSNPCASWLCGRDIVGHTILVAVDPDTGEDADIPLPS